MVSMVFSNHLLLAIGASFKSVWRHMVNAFKGILVDTVSLGYTLIHYIGLCKMKRRIV